MADDRTRGIYGKYRVERVDGHALGQCDGRVSVGHTDSRWSRCRMAERGQGPQDGRTCWASPPIQASWFVARGLLMHDPRGHCGICSYPVYVNTKGVWVHLWSKPVEMYGPHEPQVTIDCCKEHRREVA